MKILDLDLPDRVKRCLIRSRIETLEQLLELKCEDIKKVRNLGKKGLTELMAFLEYNGLQLKDGRLYSLETLEYHKRLLKEMEGKPVLCPSFKEDAIVWGVNVALRERIKHLAEKCAEQGKILDILKSRAKPVAEYPAQEKRPDIQIYIYDEDEKYETIREWLDEN